MWEMEGPLSRSSTSCWSCLVFELRCDGQVPCNNCSHGVENACFSPTTDIEGPNIDNGNNAQAQNGFDLQLWEPWLNLNTHDASDDFLNGSPMDVQGRTDSGYSPVCQEPTKCQPPTDQHEVESMTTATAPSSSLHFDSMKSPQSIATSKLASVTTYRSERTSPGTLDAAQAIPQGEAPDAYELEMSLLMHYLDSVFYVQFTHYRPSAKQGGRTWLLPRLTSSKATYYATLALGALSIHEHRIADGDATHSVDEHHGFYVEATSMLEHDMSLISSHTSPDTNMVIDAAMAIIQLYCYEVSFSA